MRTDLLVLRVLGTESACRFVWSEVVTPNAEPPRAIWLPENMKICQQTALHHFFIEKDCLIKLHFLNVSLVIFTSTFIVFVVLDTLKFRILFMGRTKNLPIALPSALMGLICC